MDFLTKTQTLSFVYRIQLRKELSECQGSQCQWILIHFSTCTIKWSNGHTIHVLGIKNEAVPLRRKV